MDLDTARDLFLRNKPVLGTPNGPQERPGTNSAAHGDFIRGNTHEDDHDSGNDSISDLTDQDMPELIPITKPAEQPRSTSIAGEDHTGSREDIPSGSVATASSTGLQTQGMIHQSKGNAPEEDLETISDHTDHQDMPEFIPITQSSQKKRQKHRSGG